MFCCNGAKYTKLTAAFSDWLLLQKSHTSMWNTCSLNLKVKMDIWWFSHVFLHQKIHKYCLYLQQGASQHFSLWCLWKPSSLDDII